MCSSDLKQMVLHKLGVGGLVWLVGTCLFLVLCVFLLVSEATKENSGCL